MISRCRKTEHELKEERQSLDDASEKVHLMWKIIAITVVCVALAAGLFWTLPSGTDITREPLGKRWPVSERISIDRIDHSIFNGLLGKYVDLDGFVDYQAWKRSVADRRALCAYFDELSRADISLPSHRNAQLAFWINAYNAVTIEGILQVYPTTSIRNHTSRLGGYNIWKHLPLQVADNTYSLEAIEHDILRKMGEPRIHFAIVCASIGCPRLRHEAYTAEHVQQQLADNARDFFSRPQNFRVAADSRTLQVSSILEWFAEDFGATQTERMEYLTPYLPVNTRNLAADPRTRVKYLPYDWNLNEQPENQ